MLKAIMAGAAGCFILMGCHHPPVPGRQIKSIEIATAGGLSVNPVVAIQIDSSLTLRYYGGRNAKPAGYYTGVVTQGFWDTLNIKLKKIDFKKLDTAQFYGMDEQVAEVAFYWGNHKRHIFKAIDGEPDSVSNTLKWIANSYKQVTLHHLKDSFKFETPFQALNLPIRKYEQVKLPPAGK